MIQKIEAGERSVLGTQLQVCCTSPRTGFYRDGTCRTGPEDTGRHVVCMRATAEFLEFSKARGNDLSTAYPEYGFPGLKPGDCWCLCALRWLEAYEAGAAPKVRLESTHESALEVIPLAALREFAE